MFKRRHTAVALGLALMGLLGLVLVARAQVGGTSAADVQELEKRLKSVDRTKPDALYALAKWCYTKKMNGEARSLAVETLQLNRDDVRAKYLLYVLAGAPLTPTTATTEPVEPQVALTEKEADAIVAREGDAMRTFPALQRVMINSCGAPLCHGGQNPDAKWALVLTDPASKMTLVQNFRTIDKYIVRGDGAERSPLLTKPLVGMGAEHPTIVFKGIKDPVYGRFLDWIRTLKTQTEMIWGETLKGGPPPTPGPPIK